MTRPEKGFGERSNDDIIREILREHASRENPIGRKEIIKHVIAMGYVKGKDKSGKDKSKIERKAIEGFVDRMGARVYETEEECDEIIRECRVTEREVIFIKKGQEGRTIGYWMMETLSDTEWMFLMDSVLNSKILTKKEADNLANRITFLAGKRFSDLTNYRHSMGNQPYFVGDDDIDEKGGYIESRVLQQVRLIRQAIKQGKKIKFNLCVYDYGNQKVRLVPYGRHPLYLEVEFPTYIEDDPKRQALRYATEALGDYLSHKSNGKEFCPDLVLKYARKYAEVCREKSLSEKTLEEAKKPEDIML